MGMATYPPRRKCLEEVVPHLMSQCTKLFVYLNGYTEIPDFLQHPRITPILGDNIGDIGKFYHLNAVKGYYFTVDDDIIYPHNYTQRMIKFIDHLGKRCVIGVHGCVLNLKNMWNYYRSRSLTHYRGRLDRERYVHLIGTGTAAFHTNTIKLDLSMFQRPNMADVWFALEGQKQRVPFVLIPRPSRWLNDSKTAPQTTSIYRKSKNKQHGKYQTKVIKEYGNWKIYS